MIQERKAFSESSNKNISEKNAINLQKNKFRVNSLNALKTDLEPLTNNNFNNEVNKTLPNSIRFFQRREHPLVFYSLGKMGNSKIENNILPLHTSQGFRSSSNDMKNRNLLSINSTFYENPKMKKEFATINKQIIDDNNYLNPLKIFRSFHKYNVSKNCENQETFNMAKKKIYTKEIISNIKNGIYLTKKEFYDEKNKLLKPKNISIDLKINSSNDNKDNINLYRTINTDGNINKSYFKDPNDYTKEKLKKKEWRFDRNYKMFIKHKNWWKKEKYDIYYF